MLDFDLAFLYQVETRVLNQAVKHNAKRFPTDFMFQLTQEEWKTMSSQFVMTSRNKRPKMALPLAFTEHDVTMLSSVLRSDVAIETNILIVRAFIAMRQLILNPLPVSNDNVTQLQREVVQLQEYVEEVFADYNDINEDTRLQFEQINRTLAEMQVRKPLPNKPRRRIGFFTERQRNNNEDLIE